MPRRPPDPSADEEQLDERSQLLLIWHDLDVAHAFISPLRTPLGLETQAELRTRLDTIATRLAELGVTSPRQASNDLLRGVVVLQPGVPPSAPPLSPPSGPARPSRARPPQGEAS